MVECKSRFGFGECIASMSAQDTVGRAVCCDIAEECEYDEKLILQYCAFSKKVDVSEDKKNE